MLTACVSTCDVEQARRTLVYGRKNTFLLFVTDDLLQIALRITEDDGPAKGEMRLLKVLIENGTVVKPTVSSPRTQLTAKESARLNQDEHNSEKKLIKAMRIAAGMKFKRIND